MAVLLYTLSLLVTHGVCQSIESYGVSGGDGPIGGIGDKAHPVLTPQAFVTDGYVPTAPNTTRQLAVGVAPVLLRSNTSSSASGRTIVVDSTKNGARQEMLGFGHAWTDSATAVFETLEPELQDQVMEDLFGQEGNNMGFMRHTVGSSDMSAVPYSYDDNGSFNAGEPDPDLSNFALGEYGTLMAQWIAKMGKYKGDVFLFGTTWSYPGWMKNNGLFIAPDLGGSHLLANNSFNPKYIPQAVEYFTKYVDAFKSYGVQVNGITLQNEPLNYEGGTTSMYLDAVDSATIMREGLGAAMSERGVKIMAYDHNTDQPIYPYRALQRAEKHIDGVAWHCYQGPVAEYEVLQDLHYAFPDQPQFMTECSNTAVVPGTTNYWVAQNFIPAVQNGSSGASMWVMATDENYGPHSSYGGCTTCLGSIVVNSSSLYTKQIDYYMIGQFSRFIRRGAINYNIPVGARQGSGTDWSAQFFVIAMQNPDGGWAVVFLCNLPDDQEVTLSFTGSGNVWQGTIPNGTVTTWLLPSDEILAKNATSPSSTTVAPYGYGNSTASAATGSVSAASTGLTASPYSVTPTTA